MIYEFTVEGDIFGKERPRVNMYTGNIYTPNKTKDYERYICECFCLKYPHYVPIETRAKIEIVAFFKIPNTLKKAEKELAAKGELSPTKKPDIDNIAKVVLDALNKVSFSYHDVFIQIHKIIVEKKYNDISKLEIKIEDY